MRRFIGVSISGLAKVVSGSAPAPIRRARLHPSSELEPKSEKRRAKFFRSMLYMLSCLALVTSGCSALRRSALSCEWEAGAAAETCQRYCSARPVHEFCHVFHRFGPVAIDAYRETGADRGRFAAALTRQGWAPEDVELAARHFAAVNGFGIASRCVTPGIAIAASLKAEKAHAAERFDAAVEHEKATFDSLASTCGQDAPESIDARIALGSTLVESGDLTTGLQHLVAAESISRAVLGNTHPQVITVLYELAWARCLSGRCDQAVRALKDALLLAQAVYGPEAPEMAELHFLLGHSYHALLSQLDLEQPDYRERLAMWYSAARGSFMDALDVAEDGEGAASSWVLSAAYRELGALDMQIATLEEFKSIAHEIKRGRASTSPIWLRTAQAVSKSRARGYFRRALEESRKRDRGSRISEGLVLMQMSHSLRFLREYGKAEQMGLTSLVIFDRALGLQSGPARDALAALVALRRVQHRGLEALRLQTLLDFEQSGKEYSKQAVMDALLHLTDLYEDQGWYQEALPHLRLACKLAEELRPTEPIEAGALLLRLGRSEGRLGDVDRALEALFAAQGLFDTVNDRESLALTLDAIGVVYRDAGLLDRAYGWFDQALDLRETSLGEQDPSIAKSLNHLALLEMKAGRFAAGKALLVRGLALLPENASAFVEVRLSLREKLATLFRRTGHPALSLQLLDEVRESYIELWGPESHRLVTSLTESARAASELGRSAEARTHLKAALRVQERTLGRLHPSTASALAELGLLDAREGHVDRALAVLGEVESRLLNWRDVSLFDPRGPDDLSGTFEMPLTLRFAIHSLRSPAQAFASLVQWQGVDAFAARLRRSGSMRRLRERYRLHAERVALLPRAQTPSARRRLESIDAELAEYVEQASELRPRELLDSSRVCAQLRMLGATLVDFTTGAAQKGASLVPHVLAFVAAPADGAPGSEACTWLRIDLGPVHRLDPLLQRWQAARTSMESQCSAGGLGTEACSTASAEMNAVGHLLRLSVWDPVESQIDPERRIFVVADGPVAQIPLSSLPDRSAPGILRYLIERLDIAHLSDPGALVVTTDGAEARGQGAVVVGNVTHAVRFDGLEAHHRKCTGDGCDRPDPVETVTRAASPADVRSGPDHPCPPESERWLDLGRYATRGGLETIARAAAAWSGAETTLIEGPLATEENLRSVSAGRRLLHIQTHGYAVGEGECVQRHGYRTVAGGARVIDRLRLSGLVLAGRNRLAREERTCADELRVCRRPDDGLLTSREIVERFDLRGTALVTLAACESGRGAAGSRGTVMGLARAFIIAGAEAAVVSQWQVPLRDTERLFIDFYQRLAAGDDPTTALVSAQRRMIARYRAQGITHSVYAWGAFVSMVGAPDAGARRKESAPDLAPEERADGVARGRQAPVGD